MESKLSESELEFLQSPQYQLKSDELQLIMSKQGERNQLLFAVMLQYYKIRLSFPTQHDGLVSYLSSTLAKEINLNTLKKGIPGAKLKHVQFALEKFKVIQPLILPSEMIAGFNRKFLLKYYERISAYSPSHIKELDKHSKYAMVAIFCHIRSELLADSLADLFIKLVKKIKNSSETFVDKAAVGEIKRVQGKFDILSQITDVAIAKPEGIIKDTIYPIIDPETLKQLKINLSQPGQWYQKQIRTKMRSLYSHGSRAELLDLLTQLIQEILSDENWRNKLKPEDFRALSPLFHAHFNPYDIFLLDLEKRLMIGKEDIIHDRSEKNSGQRESKAIAETLES